MAAVLVFIQRIQIYNAMHVPETNTLKFNVLFEKSLKKMSVFDTNQGRIGRIKSIKKNTGGAVPLKRRNIP